MSASRYNTVLLVVLAAMFAAFLPSSAAAQTVDRRDDDFMLRIGGNVIVAEGEVIGTLLVIDGDVTILGEIENDLLVISGDALISGIVGQSLTVISGDITLESTAVVNNVNSISGDIAEDAGATVLGDVTEREGFEVPFVALAAFGIYFWVASTIAVIVAGLLFAAIGGVQLTRTARTMTDRLVNTVVGGVFFWIGLPILAIILMITLVGLPLGLAVFMVVLPAVWFLGYIAAGARLGSAIIGRFSQRESVRPYAATALGLLLLQLLVLIPGIGLLFIFLAGLWGGAALAYTAFAAAGGRSFEAEPGPPPPPPAPAD